MACKKFIQEDRTCEDYPGQKCLDVKIKDCHYEMKKPEPKKEAGS